jgi:hypothetical protein
MNGELLCRRHKQLSLGSLYRRSPPRRLYDRRVIAQKRQCFLHNEQRAANIDFECGVETFGRDCSNGSMGLPTPALAKMTSMCPFSVSCSLICEAERRTPAIGARDHEADVLL